MKYFIDASGMNVKKWADNLDAAISIAKKEYENGKTDVGIGVMKRDNKNNLVHNFLPLQFYV